MVEPNVPHTEYEMPETYLAEDERAQALVLLAGKGSLSHFD